MLIINGKIFTMEKLDAEAPVLSNKLGNGVTRTTIAYENGYVRIHGKYIEEVGNMSQLYPRPYKEEILDVGGAWVLPGIIESHCHIGISEEKIGIIGDDCNEGTMPMTPALRAIDAVNPMEVFTQTLYTIIDGKVVYNYRTDEES